MQLERTIKNSFYRICYAAGYHHFLLNRIKYQQFLPILSLHRVSAEKNPFWPPLDPKIFDSLIFFLKKHFYITTLHDLEEAPHRYPKMVLTFDDGYYDFIEYAMPILHKHGIKVNQNIIPEQLLNGKPLWNINLHDFLNAAPIALIKEINFPGFDAKEVIGKNSFNKVLFGLKLSKLLKNISVVKRNIILEQLQKTIFNKLDYSQTRMIKLGEMGPVLAQHEIGVHSYSHDTMAYESIQHFSDDFTKCKTFFSKNHFPNLDIYAFPNGSYNQAHIDYLKRNDVKYILLTGDTFARANQTIINRFNIASFNQSEAVFQALGIKHFHRRGHG